jgi:hypothetical protein
MMSAMRCARWGFFLIIPLASACSLAIDLSNLAGPATNADSGADATVDGAAQVASSDAGVVDGSASDATVDGARADGGPARFCRDQTTAHSFCADFDDLDAAPTTAWDGSWTTAATFGGTVTIDTTASTSPPGSLATTMTPSSNGPQFHVDLSRSFGPPAPTVVDCSFDFRFDHGTVSGPIGNADILLDSAYDLELAVSQDGTLTLYDADGGSPAGAVVIGQWTHIRMVLDRSAPSLKVSLNGAVFLSYAPPAPPVMPAVATFVVGMEAETNATDGGQYHFDNIVCDLQ